MKDLSENISFHVYLQSSIMQELSHDSLGPTILLVCHNKSSLHASGKIYSCLFYTAI